jgi:hypothetical protein
MELFRLSSKDAEGRGVSVLYQIYINGRPAIDLAAISCSRTEITFDISRSNSKVNKDNPDRIALKVGAVNSLQEDGVYRRSPVLILASLTKQEWSVFHTAIICAKTSNVSVNGVFVRHAKKNRTDGAELRTGHSSELAEAHDACVEIYKAVKPKDQVSILETFYTMREQRASGKSSMALVSSIVRHVKSTHGKESVSGPAEIAKCADDQNGDEDSSLLCGGHQNDGISDMPKKHHRPITCNLLMSSAVVCNDDDDDEYDDYFKY